MTVVAATVSLGAAGACAAPVVDAASGARFYVANGGSSGGPCSKSRPCSSLARAVTLANHVAYGTPVTIYVGQGMFVTHLNFPDKLVNEPSLTIIGASESGTVLTARGSGQVLFALTLAPNITMEDLTISGATGSASSQGGAVHWGGFTADFTDVTFRDNSAPANSYGGAVEDDGGIMNITGSTFFHNSVGPTAAAGGGAIAEAGGTLTITASLFTDNTVTGVGTGGAIFIEDGKFSLVDSTVTGNTATGSATGGAIGLDGQGTASIIGSTLNGNTADGLGGLVDSVGSSHVGFGGDILVANVGSVGSVCSGTGVKDLGHNVIDQHACGMGSTSEVATAGAVGLLPLAANGGPTRTERIKKSSAAHDVVAKGATIGGKRFCAGVDERGVPRQQGPASKCDAGAYQFAPPVITAISPHKGAPGVAVSIRGYGFDFLTLVFGGGHPRFTVSGDVAIATRVPSLGKGGVTITLSNPDGTAKTTFQVLSPPK